MKLTRVLGPTQLFFYSVGVIIGAGVYSVIGVAAGLAGEGLWVSFLIGAVAALLTGLSYAEMATTFPAAGAEYIYVGLAWPKAEWASFSIGLILLIGGAATATTVAVAFGGYLKTFVDIPVWFSAAALLTLCTGLNILGLRESSWANIVFTLIEIGGLLLVIVAGLTRENFGEPLFTLPSSNVVAGAAVLFFVYLGFEEIANLAEEVRDPGRDIPRAIFLSLGVTTVLYVLIALAAMALASPRELAGSEAPLALAIAKVWPQASGLISGIALFATANTVLITVIATARVGFSMGRDGEMPRPLGRLLPKRQTPWIAALVIYVIALLLVPFGSLGFLAGLSSFAAVLAFLAVNLALIALRYRKPAHKRPFRVPFAIGKLPIIPLLAIGALGLLLVHFEKEVYVAGAMALVLAAVALALRRLTPMSARRSRNK